MRFIKRRTGLACFSPEVMLTTFVLELVLAIYTYLRYRTSEFGRIAFALIALLATFQFAEYQICSNVLPAVWARIGFVAITLLPVLGLHLVALCTRNTDLLKAGYALGFAAIAAMIFLPGLIEGGVCLGNYVIFKTAPEAHLIYSVYYFSFLFLAMFKIWEALVHKETPRAVRPLLGWLMAGYLVFLVPTGITTALNGGAARAIPSVMCGFALMLAVILVWRILPLYHRLKS